MNENELRDYFVTVARGYYGFSEMDGTHKQIVDLYNSHKPLARSYPLKYTDDWCAGYVSAMAIKCNLTDIIPTEVSCPKMITLFQNKGRWMEADSYTPKVGDIIFYDFDDSGAGDNTGNSDHVGIVVRVTDNIIRVIEGNMSDKVWHRDIAVNGKYIRGYGLPDFAAKVGQASKPVAAPQATASSTITIELPTLSKGSKCNEVYALQAMLNAFNKAGLSIDGDFGSMTQTAVKNYQKARGLEADGIVGKQTWTQLLKK